MKLSLKLTSVFIGLTLTAFVAQAGSCCGAGKDSDKDNAVPTASVAMATPTVECAAGDKGFFARLFSRFGSSRTATVAKSEDCSACPAKAGASLAVLNKECDKDESKSKGCCPAQATVAQLLLANASCGDSEGCTGKVSQIAQTDCKACPCPEAVAVCVKECAKKCSPCTREASIPVAAAAQ